VRCATTVDGPVNRNVFEAFIGQVLAPALAPGDVVVMDNLSSHKGPRVRELVEAAGATVVYLPPYSPNLNPIELTFAKLKQLTRSAPHDRRRALAGRPADARPVHARRRRRLHPPLRVHATVK
jgi:transposase